MNLDKMKKAELADLVKELQGKLSRLEDIEKNHRKTEKELLESQKKHELLAENVNDVIWTMDLDLQYTYISPSVHRMRGYTAEEAMSQKLDDIFLPDACEAIRKAFREELDLIEAGSTEVYRSRTLEARLKRKDGSVVWVEIKAAFIPGEDGRPVGILGITRDIDKRKRAELALQESQSLYRLLAENVTDVIWTMDTSLRYIYMSPSVSRQRGYRIEEVKSQSLEDTVSPASYEICKQVLQEELARERKGGPEGSTTRTLELEVMRKDGSFFWAEVKVTFMPDKNGQLALILGVTRDIQRRKQAEDELKRHASELERTNKELEALMEEIRSLSLADELTGLYNRRGFLTLARQQLKIADRMGRGLSIFFFDLDGMKGINDTLGHAEGDNALRDTADVLRETFRESDIIARLGGDEFVVMAIESPEGGFETFAIRLKHHLREHNEQASRPYKLALSMGIAHYEPRDPCSIEKLLERADSLMYENKRAKQKT